MLCEYSMVSLPVCKESSDVVAPSFVLTLVKSDSSRLRIEPSLLALPSAVSFSSTTASGVTLCLSGLLLESHSEDYWRGDQNLVSFSSTTSFFFDWLLLENSALLLSICICSLVLIALVFGFTLLISSYSDSSDSKSEEEEEGGFSLVVSLPTDPLSSESAILALLHG